MKKPAYFTLYMWFLFFLSCSPNNPTSSTNDRNLPNSVYNVVINEIETGNIDAVELRNTGSETVNLDGWILKTGDIEQVLHFELPSIDLLPGACILLNEKSGTPGDSVCFLETSVEGYTNINWSDYTAGAVELIDDNFASADYIEWGNYALKNILPDKWSGPIIDIPLLGYTIGRDINSTDTNHSSDIILLIGTPGRINHSNPIILSTALDECVVGLQYEDKIKAAGPAPPFSYEIVSGSMPEGLSVESDGYIRGTASEAGEFTFNIRILDSQSPPKPALTTMRITIYDVDLTFSKNALLVNGVHWDTYGDEIKNAYIAKAFWGNYTVDFWDVFEEPSGGYPGTLPAPLGHGAVPMSVLGGYSAVIWIGNNYAGDLEPWRETPIFTYIEFGGNLLIMTREAQDFIEGEFKDYLGVNWGEVRTEINNCIAVYPGLLNIAVNSNHTYVDVFHTSLLDDESTLIFKETQSFFGERGLGVWKKPAAGGRFRIDGGQVVLLTIRPYRVNAVHLRANVEFILSNFFNISAFNASKRTK
ncbi:hypothetical protein AMJ80_03450 [bacterium SM23_31]|nr:MAG: hypothetical protein AMJ80_03450 [bacterium SM23_31]